MNLYRIKTRSIIALITALCISAACALFAFKTVKAESGEREQGSDIVLSDDFTTTPKGGATVGKVDNVVFDNNATYGAVTGSKWDTKVSGGTGSVVYEISADNGYAINGGKIKFTAGIGHGSGRYWWNSTHYGGQNKLGADFTVYVGYDGENWNKIYNDFSDNGTITRNQDGWAENGKFSPELQLDEIISATSKLYVKFELYNFSCEEIWVDNEKDGIFLGNMGVFLYNTSIEVTQKELSVTTVSDDFTAAGKTGVTYCNAYSHKGLTSDENSGGHNMFGLVPSEKWDAKIKMGTGELVYKLTADGGEVFGNTSLEIDLKYFAVSDTYRNGNANVLVSLGYDLTNYETVYNLYNEKGIGTSQERSVLKVPLTEYASGYQTLYVKITVVCPEVEADLQSVPVCLYGVKLTAENITAVKGRINVSSSFGKDKRANIVGNFDGIVDAKNVCDGNYSFGLIPSSAWDGSVTAGDGYITYKLTSEQGKAFKNLNLGVAFRLLKGANIVISVSDDGNNFTPFYDVVKKEGENAYKNPQEHPSGNEMYYYRTLDLDLKSAIEFSEVVYVRIAMCHPAEKVQLQQLKTLIYSVSFGANITDKIDGAGSISYNLDGGYYENGQSNPSFYRENDDIELVSPVKKYYTFCGWFASSDFSGDPILKLDTSVIKNYRLFAKWEDAEYTYSIIVAGDGKGEVKVNGSAFDGNPFKVKAKSDVKISLSVEENSLICGVIVDGEDVRLDGNSEYIVSSAEKDREIEVTFLARATHTGDFSIDYSDNKIYGNKWKIGLYDYANLYITDEAYHMLGINGGEGYLVYKFEAPAGKTFESIEITSVAKLFDYFCLKTREKVNYSVGYDGENYTLVYESPITRVGDNIKEITRDLTEWVNGRKTFFLKIDVGSNSTNWTLLKSLSVKVDYEKVETIVNYGGIYEEAYYTQYKGDKFDRSVISPRNGVALLSDEIFTDSGYTEIFDLNSTVENDLKLFVKCAGASGKLEYDLDGGVNDSRNIGTYDSSSDVYIYEPTKQGYIFAGWYVDEARTVLFEKIVAGRTGDIKLYAKWIKDSPVVKLYKITYELNGGTNGDNPDEILSNEKITLKNATKTGCVFDGWYLGDKKIDELDGAELTSDITLTAKFISDGGDSSGGNSSASDGSGEISGGCNGCKGEASLALTGILAACALVFVKKISEAKR